MMAITNVRTDEDALTLSIESEFASSPTRVWQVWADPRQLERWWGPPTYPATVETHEFVAGGSVGYFMTGPGGDRVHGWWRLLTIDEPHSIEFEDGFADANGAPDPQTPVMIIRVTLEETSTHGTRMTIMTTFASIDDMHYVMSRGMKEGMSQAISQLDTMV
ncbi:MAG: SRPBCC family protein [Acidimicrobiales bacterium]